LGAFVLSTFHTVDVVQTITRMVNFFPPYLHDEVRLQISVILKGIISLRLLPRKDKPGRIPAYETMVKPFRVIEDALMAGAVTGALEKQALLLSEALRSKNRPAEEFLKMDLGKLKYMLDSAKIIAYEAASGDWTSKALFLSDNADDAGDFPKDSADMAALFPLVNKVHKATKMPMLLSISLVLLVLLMFLIAVGFAIIPQLSVEVHRAMVARGYQGEVRILSSFRIRRRDFLWMAFCASLSGVLIYFGR